MPNQEMLHMNHGFYSAWRTFTEKSILERELIRPVIADSWLRSQAYGIDPYTKIIEVKLTEKSLFNRIDSYKDLLETVEPYINSLYKLVNGSGLIVRLADEEGYILASIGDEELIKECGNLNIFLGCCVREDVIGTNAIGTALAIGEAIQVFAAEHFCRQYHGWTSSAAPIKGTAGRIIGVLSVTGSHEKVHPHTLGMVVAACEAIENQLKFNRMNRRLMLANQHFRAIMESISDGLISVNNEGKIMDINLMARKLLNVSEKQVLLKSIALILTKESENKINKVLENGRGLIEEEFCFKMKNGKMLFCITTVTPIKDQVSNKVEWIVMTFRELKKVHNLINKIVGSEARFVFEDILGDSHQILETKRIAIIAARNNSTVLLQGESGTGKELFAQAIHNSSSRKNGPFIFINCGAIPRELVASELFGYVEGAFTGAKRGGHPGKFELADGGTIFLDEIGDMPLDAQVSLLRVLETKEIVRVGGHNVIPVNVRVIAATHKDLREEVEKGNFRQDLYYRLNVTPIQIPPLRQRKEDLKLLIDYFIEKFSKTFYKDITGISNSFYSILKNYDWPGNVRELQNVLQQIMNYVDDGEVLGPQHIPTSFSTTKASSKVSAIKALMSLDEVEKKAIIETLEKLEGNIAQTAKILGISRSSLYRKLEKYKIQMS
ncbi:MAG: sigma 54-interacting transcriptional regulator [Thermotaleaceae bacterium]